MPSRRQILSALAAPALPLAAAAADAPVRIGIIATYSGPYADYGRQFDAGIALYLQEHGETLAGRGVEFIRKDAAGPAPEVARGFAQDLVGKERIDILTGLDFSTYAYAVAPVITQAKIPTVVMNASSSGITAASPYIARVSFTVQQVSDPMARWMLRNGIRDAFTVVADFTSGIDAETAFAAAFIGGGGTIAGQFRVTLDSSDFAACIQRIRQVRPRSVFFFFPAGAMPMAFLKAWKQSGVEELGVRLFATGDATSDAYLEATGDVALGLITSHHYSYTHVSPKNQKFVADFAARFGRERRPSYFAVTAYDAMAAIDLALKRTRGDLGGNRMMEALRGLRFESPRGPIEIDPATRDIVQTVYIRKVEKVEGKLVNVEFDRFERVKDPGKQAR
ncbi:ABC transporter substrate-binding protein [Xylophilus rhododendri]|uniref:ABC transporter substrate-binding protein n=1 Tax=Xylophilus rhododendri TaxID=2697032 RepID=A0A857J8M6_9BURK|nr:ABC transporter substrate-binding protein [Xylophilus rhododendri]QHJ00068.1 ABC transporter substrate-binding protein [Xylophilus rhododendri]